MPRQKVQPQCLQVGVWAAPLRAFGWARWPVVLLALGCAGEATSPPGADADTSGGLDVASEDIAGSLDVTGLDVPNLDTPDLDTPTLDLPDLDATDLETPGPDSAETGDTGEDPNGPALPASVVCKPAADACAALPVVPGLHASYRKDHYFSDEVYDEYTAYPLDGGRFQLSGIAATSGAITSATLDGVAFETLIDVPSPRLEWFHVQPDVLVAGEPVWIAFHSRDPTWDTEGATGTVRIQTSAGLALDSAFTPTVTPAPITYITLSEDRSTLLVHVRNDDTIPHTAIALLVNGRDVMGGGVACVADPVMAPGTAALWTVPLCEPMTPGSPVTVVVDYATAPSAVGVWRALRPHFPIEAWGVSGDCAVPGANPDAFEAHLEAGFDTLYLYWGGNAECGYSTQTLVNETIPADYPGLYVLVGDDLLNQASPETAIKDSSAVAGFLVGDESDGQIYLEDGRPKAAEKAADAKQLWSMYPELTVYNGAMTNGNVGTFAGMVDVQGIDAYIGACAPYITAFEKARPPRVVHDYLRNTRDNHMPGTTWFYAQGLHGGWNVGEDPVKHVQPAVQELLVQAMMVLTSGGKGLMWFQTSQEEAAFSPERWEAMGDANWAIRAVRRLVREGDVTGAASSSGGEQVLVEAIRSRDAIVVPVVGLATDNVVDYVSCIEWLFDDVDPPAWIFSQQEVEVTVAIPGDIGVTEVFEVRLDRTTADSDWISDAGSRKIRLPGVAISNERPVRLFVLAANPSVRAAVDAALGGGAP